jgi:hypothetical protein
MGPIRVHEFISLDGVIDAPTWTFPFGFDPRMGEAIARATGGSDGILLGRTTYEMFAPAWSTRTAEEDPGAPFFNDTTKYVVSSTLTTPAWQNSELIGGTTPSGSSSSRRSPPPVSTSAAARPWCTPSSPTGSSTSCTCSCTR